MGDLQGLPVLIRDKVGLHQEAVDQSERHWEHSHSEQTCGVKNWLEMNSMEEKEVTTIYNIITGVHINGKKM